LADSNLVGIHACIVNIDGMVKDTPSYISTGGSLSDEKFIYPDHVAETYYQLHRQHKSAWTHELDLRPYLENW